MAQFDGLDEVLTSISDDYRKWEELAYVLEVDDINVNQYAPDALAKIFNKEIRHNYGHTLANPFRDEYTPDYEEILPAAYLHLSGEDPTTFKVPDPVLKGRRRTLGDFINKPRRAQDDEILMLEKQILLQMLQLEKYHSDNKHHMKAAQIVYLESICGLESFEELTMAARMAAPEEIIREEAAENLPDKPQMTAQDALKRIDLKTKDEEVGFLEGLLTPETLVEGIEKIIDLTGDTNWPKTIGAVALIASYRMQMLKLLKAKNLDALDKAKEEEHRIGFKPHDEEEEVKPRVEEPKAIGFHPEK